MLEHVTFPHPNNWQHISLVSELHMHADHCRRPHLNADCREFAFLWFHRIHRPLLRESWVIFILQTETIGTVFAVGTMYLLIKAQRFNIDMTWVKSLVGRCVVWSGNVSG